jgi:hypothetical protein
VLAVEFLTDSVHLFRQQAHFAANGGVCVLQFFLGCQPRGGVLNRLDQLLPRGHGWQQLRDARRARVDVSEQLFDVEWLHLTNSSGNSARGA